MPTSVLTSVLKSVSARGVVIVVAVALAVAVAVWVRARATGPDQGPDQGPEPFAPLGRLVRRVVDPSPQCTFAQCIECQGGATLRRTALGVPTCCMKHGEKCGVCEYVDSRGKTRIQISDSCPAAVRKLYA